jgi:hypothetical protein
MSLIRRGLEQRSLGQFNNYVTPFTSMYGQTSVSTAAGERVDEVTALGLTVVLRCVTLLADTVASLPLRTYRQRAGERVSIPLPNVLVSPDVESTGFELVHSTMASLGLHGNAYLYLDRDNRGNVINITPLHPYQMQVLSDKTAERRRYLHLGTDIPNDQMIHIRWFTPPQSLVGVSPLIQSRQIVGLGLAMDRYLAGFYGDGATPSSVLESDRDLTTDQARTLQATWEAQHRKHRRPAVLSGGLKYRPITTSASDSQMIETREQIVRDVARIYGIPSHLIGAMGDNQTYQNVEQASLNYLMHTVTPWLRRLEIAFSRVLPYGTDVAFDTSALLRTDALTRAQVGRLQIESGTRSPNELRLLDGLEPYEGGNEFHQALQGTVLNGGDQPALGNEATPTTPMMGVLDA